MYYQKHLLTLAVAASLVACGGSGGGSSSSDRKPDPVAVSEGNLSQAVQIQGAVPVQTTIPENLTPISLSNSEQVVVSANSSFSLNLSTPSVAGKNVAGYLIEFPDGTQQFIRAAQPSALAANVQAAYAEPAKKQSVSATKSKSVKRISQAYSPALAEAPRSGETTLTISGWSNGSFVLDQSLENLTLRILPLLVNESVANIAELTFAQILAADGFDMSMVQELALAVEAVATSTVQISLTWDTETDVDLYVLEPGFEYTPPSSGEVMPVAVVAEDPAPDRLVSYFNTVSATSLGWLDRDNTEAYGPENITFNYQMPAGEYEIAVNYYYGIPETNYTVTITIGDNAPVVRKGTFAEDSSNEGDLADDAGTDVVYSFTVGNSLNNQLADKVSLSQYRGLWQLPEEASQQGYIRIDNDAISFYRIFSAEGASSCSFEESYDLAFLPTGFRVNGGLQVSDAFISGENNYTYAYRTLMQVSDSAIEGCSISQGEELL